MEKAYIEKRISDYSYKVRIPKYHKIESSATANSTDLLPTALVCITPGCRVSYNVGDIVWVDFENESTGDPIIIGLLYRESDGGTYTTLSEKIIFPDLNLPSYENRFLAVELRSIAVELGTLSIPATENSIGAATALTVRFLPFLTYTSLGTSTDEEAFFKTLIQWICTNYTKDLMALYIGNCLPNSAGLILLTIYNTADLDDNGYPRYCTALFLSLSTTIHTFGFNNFEWYYN